MYHNPVLLHESILGLNIIPDGIYVDTTFGGGGHTRAILEKMEGGKLFAFDQDKDALANIPNDERFILINQNFTWHQASKFYWQLLWFICLLLNFKNTCTQVK